MKSIVRKTVCLPLDDVRELLRIVDTKGGRKKSYTLSGEVAAAVRDYITRYNAQQEEAMMTPVWQQLLNQRFDQLEAWLRPGVWGGGTYSATAALMLLEVLCGKSVDPAKAKEHFELIRGRAWKILRQGNSADGS